VNPRDTLLDTAAVAAVEYPGDPDRGRSSGMDGLRELLEQVRERNLAAGHLRGLFHVAIGRRITTTAGQLVSAGATWRELAALLKLLRFDKDHVTEVGADPDELAPRDRQRYWYSAIALARPDSPEALADAEKLIPLLKPLGYVVSPPPSAAKQTPAPPPKSVKRKDAGPPPRKKK
jgi:hypothetical protein